MAADIIHPGHLNIIKESAKLGYVMVGLFSDKAIASYKRVPLMNYEQRKQIVEFLKGVDEVVMQDEKDYSANLIKYKHCLFYLRFCTLIAVFFLLNNCCRLCKNIFRI